MKQPKVSIITPVYGVERYIERCAHSLFNQTMSRDVEYIFVIDASPDRSLDVLKEVVAQYSWLDVKIVEQPYNMGVAAARSVGIHKAKGEYTLHADSDDWFELTMIEELYEKAVSEDADMVLCDYFVNYSNGKQVYKTQYADGLPASTVIEKIVSGTLHGSLCNKLIRRDLYDIFGVDFEPGINMWEDMLVCVKLMLKNPKIAYLNRAFVHYVQYLQGSLTRNVSQMSLNSMIRVADIIVPFVSQPYGAYLQLIVKKECLCNSVEDEELRMNCDLYNDASDMILSHPSLPIHYKLMLNWAVKKRVKRIKVLNKLIRLMKK